MKQPEQPKVVVTTTLRTVIVVAGKWIFVREVKK